MASPLDQLAPGDGVLIRSSRAATSWPSFYRATVVKLTARQVVVERKVRGGVPTEERFRRDDGRKVGERQFDHTAIVDESDEQTQGELTRARQRAQRDRIDSLHAKWRRDPDDIAGAMALRDELDHYLRTYAPQEGTP